MKPLKDIKPLPNGNRMIRFDLELTEQQLKTFQKLCDDNHRTRKNMAEYLILREINKTH